MAKMVSGNVKKLTAGAVKKSTGGVSRGDTTMPRGPGKTSRAGMKPKMAGSGKCEY